MYRNGIEIVSIFFQHGQEVRASEHVTASLSKDAASGDGETTSLPDVEKLQVHTTFSSFIPHFFFHFMPHLAPFFGFNTLSKGKCKNQFQSGCPTLKNCMYFFTLLKKNEIM